MSEQAAAGSEPGADGAGRWGRAVTAGVLAALVGIGLWVRLAYINQPVRRDEAVSVLHYAVLPVHEIVTDYSNTNNHILHNLLVHGLMRVLGLKAWVVRLPALASGLALIVAAYLVGREVHGCAAGLLAAGLMASNSLIVEFSTNARGHITVLVLAALAAWQAHRIVRRGRGWVLFVALNVIGFLFVPVMLYPFGGIALWLLASGLLSSVPGTSRRAFAARLAAACTAVVLVTFICYLPALLTYGTRPFADNLYTQVGFWPTLETLLDLPVVMWRLWHRDVPTTLALVVAGLAGLGMLVPIADWKPGRLPMLLPMVLFPVAFTLVKPILVFVPNWLFVLLFYGLSAAIGLAALLSALRRPRIILAVAAGLALAMAGVEGMRVVRSGEVALSKLTGRFHGAEAMALYLKETLRPKDFVVISDHGDSQVRFYAHQHGLTVDRFGRQWPLEDTDRFFLLLAAGDEPNAALISRDLRGRPRVVRREGDGVLYEVEKWSTVGGEE